MHGRKYVIITCDQANFSRSLHSLYGCHAKNGPDTILLQIVGSRPDFGRDSNESDWLIQQ